MEHALGDVMERLGELEPSREIEVMRNLAREFEAEMMRWEEEPPDEPTRVALLKRVLDLNIEIIRAGAPTSTRPADEADREDEFPKKM